MAIPKIHTFHSFEKPCWRLELRVLTDCFGQEPAINWVSLHLDGLGRDVVMEHCACQHVAVTRVPTYAEASELLHCILSSRQTNAT